MEIPAPVQKRSLNPVQVLIILALFVLFLGAFLFFISGGLPIMGESISGYDISLSYPEKWVMRRELDAKQIFLVRMEGVYLLIMKPTGTNISINDMTDDVWAPLPPLPQGETRSVVQEHVSINDQVFTKITTLTVGQTTFKSVHWSTTRRGKLYVFSYSAKAGQFEEFLPEVQRMIESIRFE